MSNLILEAKVTGSRLIVSPTRLASGSCNVVQIRFVFEDPNDTSWEGYGKTAVFYCKKDEVYHVLLADNLATVPHEVLEAEGFFYFGLMGAKGTAIHTTEVVRLTVNQGAITTPTNESEEHTPDIYEQLLGAYGVQESRINELVAMRSTTGGTSIELQDEGLSGGSIVTNGTSAAIYIILDGLSIVPGDYHETDAIIPPNFAPLFNMADDYGMAWVALKVFHSDLEVWIVPDYAEWLSPGQPVLESATGWARIRTYNNSDEVANIYGARAYGFYDLANPSISEVADARVDANGKTWPTLGDHLRGLAAGGGIEPTDGDIPKVFLNGENFSKMTTAKNEVDMELDYVSKTDRFHSFIKIKYQGSSSLSYDKKNFTIKLYEDESREAKQEKIFKDWGRPSNKYVLKANWVDHSHARNILCANLWSDVVASRTDYDTLPAELKNSPRHGAVDGFPIKVYVNGVYQGIYTWNIGKDAWLWGMDEDNANHVLLCGEQNRDNNATTDIATATNFRELWSGTDGDDWSIEVGENSYELQDSLNALISCVKDTDDATFKATLGNYLDIQSALDYYLLVHTVLAIDNLARNMLLATFNGSKWYCGAYDLDNTWGWDGGRVPEDCTETHSLLWQRIESLFADELAARYNELRDSAFSHSNIISKLEHFMETIGTELYAEDLTIFPGIPHQENDTLAGFRSIIVNRRELVDAEVNSFGYLYRLPEATTFDGSSTMIDTGVTLFDAPKDFTIFANIDAPNDQTSEAQLLGGNETFNYTLVVRAQNNFFSVFVNDARQKTDDEANGSWGHTWERTKGIALVYKGGVFQYGYYLKDRNGARSVLHINTSAGLTYKQTAGTLTLGARPSEWGSNPTFYWKGTINDFRIYSRALSEQEVFERLQQI